MNELLWPPIGSYFDTTARYPRRENEPLGDWMERIKAKVVEDAAPPLPYREPGADDE